MRSILWAASRRGSAASRALAIPRSCHGQVVAAVGPRGAQAVPQHRGWQAPRGGQRTFATQGRESVSAVASAADPVEPEDALALLERVLEAIETNGLLLEEVALEPEVTAFLDRFSRASADMIPQAVRGALVAFSRAQHMPPAVWRGGFSERLVGILEELEDLQAVHVALLMAALDLRHPPEVLQEVVENLSFRSDTLTPTGLAAATVAISQLGPWHGPVPCGDVLDMLNANVGSLSKRELCSSALAAATLGVDNAQFWTNFHAALLNQVPYLEAAHFADVVLALATTRIFPISLLEALQDRLPHLAGEMHTEEALTSVWALASMQIFPPQSVWRMLEQICPADGTGAPLTDAQARQLQQVMLSLELESGAAKAAAEVPPALRSRIAAACEDAVGLDAEAAFGDEGVVEEVAELLIAEDADFALSETVHDLYVVDVIVRGASSGQGVAFILDGACDEEAVAPRDPWAALKLRHLARLGYTVKWLPAQRWRGWDEETREGFVKSLLPS